jgi:predicted  nucleic acid-binding Zn-ribbon protein
MLETRKFEEAVTFLEAQPKSFVRKNEFTAALEKARSEQDTVKSVKAAIEKATEAITKGDFGSGQKILEACKKSYGETPEVKQAFADFEAKRVAAAKTKLDKAIKDARMLLLARQYAAAMRELENVAPLVSAATPDLQKQFETLKHDASAGAARIQKEVDLGKTIVAGSQEMSQTMVAGSVEAAAAGVGAARAPASRASAAPYRPAPAPVVVKKSPAMTITVVILALVVVAGIAYFMLNKPSAGGGATGGATTYLEINAVPYGTVKSITGKDGKTVDLKDNQTPVRVAVAPGEYTIVVTGPNGQEDTQKKSATNDAPGSDTAVFQQVDVDKILQSQ